MSGWRLAMLSEELVTLELPMKSVDTSKTMKLLALARSKLHEGSKWFDVAGLAVDYESGKIGWRVVQGGAVFLATFRLRRRLGLDGLCRELELMFGKTVAPALDDSRVGEATMVPMGGRG